MLGSVMERLLRKVQIHILTVSHLDLKHTVHMSEPVPLRKIVYATNLAEESSGHLHFVGELARGAGATLPVMHVIEPPVPFYISAELVTMPALDRNAIRG